MHAIRVHEHGGQEQLRYEEVRTPEPGPNQALIKLEATGINFIEVYHRTGLYPQQLPITLGKEGAGTVTAIGPGVVEVKVGDRVASVDIDGTYAEYAVAPAARLVPVPDGIDSKTAAAVMLQGMTAHYLSHDTFPLKPGDQALVHAAAGGVGLLLVQLAKQRGAYVIGTVSTEAKAELARAAGADEVIMYTQTNFVDEVKRLTGGKGVDVVYDSVGKTTFEGSLDSLKIRGTLVTFGQSSGAIPPISVGILNTKGSLYLTRPTLYHYVVTRDELLTRAGVLFDLIGAGKLDVRIDHAFPLAEAADAHRLLESRGSTGKLLLIP